MWRERKTLPLWSAPAVGKQRDGAESLGRVRTGAQSAGMF